LVSACGTLRGANASSPSRLVTSRSLDLEHELALDHVERLVEVVLVQVRAFGPRRHDVLDHGHVTAGLLAAEQDLGAEIRDCHRLILSIASTVGRGTGSYAPAG